MMSVGIVIAIFFAATQTVIGHVFSQDHDVIKWASKLGAFCGAYFVECHICLLRILGQARPHVAALSMFAGLWGLSVPTAYLFGFVWPTHHGFGLLGVWTGLTTGYSAMTLVMLYFVIRSDWVQFAKDALKRSEADKKVSLSNSDDDDNEDV